jgi:DNA processing protein
MTAYMCKDLLYQLALTQIPHIGCVHAKLLIEQFHTAEAIFKASVWELEKMEGIGTVRARSIKNFKQFQQAEKEIAFIEKYHIMPLFLTDAAYPQRLLHCYDSPTLLFSRGQANLNASRVVAIIGTRSNTAYGRQFTEKLVQHLAAWDVLVVSGLAFGIDAIAHKCAIQNKLPTVGVLAHGLHSMYPAQHAQLARDMVKEGGGLLTEFGHQVMADKHNFPTRNRIVAGISDAIVVIETGEKGGSMITAELANGYNKDVFAVPGRTTDVKSAGCNQLIRNNKAMLLTDAEQLAGVMGWSDPTRPVIVPQKELFIELNAPEKALVQLMQEKEEVHIDELHLRSGLSHSTVAAAMLQLELQNMVSSLPGRMYRLNA